MRSTGFDPARLDVKALAHAGASLQGRLPLSGLARLAESTVTPADGSADLAWSVQGQLKQLVGRAAEIRIRLQVQATVFQTCQRCLQPMALPLAIDRTIRFVPGEDDAARLDEELDDEDVLALPRGLDLMELVEDELILALPIVPRHEVCPQPISFNTEANADFLEADLERPNPFAVLAGLKPKP